MEFLKQFSKYFILMGGAGKKFIEARNNYSMEIIENLLKFKLNNFTPHLIEQHELWVESVRRMEDPLRLFTIQSLFFRDETQMKHLALHSEPVKCQVCKEALLSYSHALTGCMQAEKDQFYAQRHNALASIVRDFLSTIKHDHSKILSPEQYPSEFQPKIPDIVLKVSESEYLVGDITVSKDLTFSAQKKKRKYKDLPFRVNDIIVFGLTPNGLPYYKMNDELFRDKSYFSQKKLGLHAHRDCIRDFYISLITQVNKSNLEIWTKCYPSQS